MSTPTYDLGGLPSARPRVPDFDLSWERPAGPDYDLSPVDLRQAWDLDILLQKAPVPEVEYAAWLQSLRDLTTGAARQDKNLHSRLAAMLGILEAPFATVAFGGHFKTGKSTLLNAALGRQILPSADLPETGAICVLRAGETDAVEVVDGTSRHTVPCTLEAIQQETSLIGQVGERRTQVHQVERLEISLAGCGIPPQARWIDSPGINDTEEMNACALRAARQADVLLWVLSSRQPLSEVEMAFLAGYIAERGPTGVVFVLNAFLPENTPEAWEAFLARKAPWIQDKVQYHAPYLGFTPEAPPHVAPVSGLGLFGDSENDFGRTELRRLLLGLGSPEVPRIRRARLGRVSLDLRALIEESEQLQEKQRAETEVRQQAEEQARHEAERRQPLFERDVRQAVTTYADRWSASARHCAASLCTSITGAWLARDDRYSRQWKETLTQIAAMMANGLVREVRRLAAEHGQPVPDSEEEEKLRRLLMPSPVGVIVADTPANDSAAQTAARVDGTVRSLLQPIGINVSPALGATLNSTLGTHRETPEKRERDAALTRQNVQQAAEQASTWLQARQEEVCAQIRRGCAPDTEGDAAPEVPRLSYRDESLETILRLAQQAERLAAQDGTS